MTMALFPAFAGVAEAPDSGRKGEPPGGMKKALGGLAGAGSRPLPWVCLSACIPEFSAALQGPLGGRALGGLLGRRCSIQSGREAGGAAGWGFCTAMASRPAFLPRHGYFICETEAVVFSRGRLLIQVLGVLHYSLLSSPFYLFLNRWVPVFWPNQS